MSGLAFFDANVLVRVLNSVRVQQLKLAPAFALRCAVLGRAL